MMTPDEFAQHVQKVIDTKRDFYGDVEIFASRCTFRGLPLCVNENGNLLFDESPNKTLFILLCSSIYSWLWKSDVNFILHAMSQPARSPIVFSILKSGKVLANSSELISVISSARHTVDVTCSFGLAPESFDKSQWERIAKDVSNSAKDVLDAAKLKSEEYYIECLDSMMKDIDYLNKGYDIKSNPLFLNNGDKIKFVSTFTESLKLNFGLKFAEDYSSLVVGGGRVRRLGDWESVYKRYDDYWMKSFYMPLQDSSDSIESKDFEVNVVDSGYLYRSSGIFHPDCIAKKDYLDRKPLSDALFKWISESDNKSNLVVGLFGEWGVGKSTFINILKNKSVSSHDKSLGFIQKLKSVVFPIQSWVVGTIEDWTSVIDAFKPLKFRTLNGGFRLVKMSDMISVNFLLQVVEDVFRQAVVSLKKIGFYYRDVDDGNSDVYLIWGEFNAWRYEHSDNIQAGITQEAVKALKSQLGWLGRIRLTITYVLNIHRVKFFLWALFFVLTFIAFVLTISSVSGKVVTALYEVGLSGIFDYFINKIVTVDPITAAITLVLPSQIVIFWFLYQKAQGIFSHPLADKLNTYLRLPDFGKHLGSIPVMREQVALLTQLRFKIPSLIATEKRWWKFCFNYRKSGKNQRLIFIVDDLDRCSPEGVVKTLEAIRLVMDLDNVVVIVAIDQRVALASLAKHYEKLEKHHLLNAHEIARDYLSKVIHIPIVLEQPSKIDVDHYLTNNLWENEGGHKVDQVHSLLDKNPEGSNNSKDATSDIDRNSEFESESEKSLGEKSEHLRNEVSENNSNTEKIDANSVEITGLSQAQKNIFLSIVKQLGISNPRQLKRLDNCYSLLRLRYPDEDVHQNYYRLRMLIWLEYLHEQPSSLRRQFLTAWEQGREFSIDSVDNNDAYIEAKNHWNAIAASLPQDIQQTIYREVRCFILPAG